MKKAQGFIIFVLLCIVGALSYTIYYLYNNYEITEVTPTEDKFSSIVKSINDVAVDEELYVKVKSASVDVRKINVISDDNKIGVVHLNEIYLVRDVKKGTQYYWYLIQDADGNLGYIPSGEDVLYVETIKIKGDVEVILSKISDYVENNDIVVPSTSIPITDTTTTTVIQPTQSTTTKCDVCATKKLPTTTTTTTTKTTTKTTKPTREKIVISTTESVPLELGLKIRFDAVNKTIIAEVTKLEGGTPPYQLTLSLYKDGELLETTSEMSIEVPATSATYTIYGKVVDSTGLDVEGAKDFTIGGL